MRRLSMLLAVNLTFVTSALIHSAYAYTMKPVEPQRKQTTDTKAQPAQPDTPSLSGKIVETMNSGGYTYLCIEKDGKKTWAAVHEMKVSVGDEISLEPGYEMEGFTSKTLNRTFDKIVFSAGPVGSASPHGHGGMGHGGMGSSEGMGSKGTAVVPQEKIKVEKASGKNAYTVAELHEKRAELDQKNITVKGKVVKVSGGILGKNWIHIQDGTGNPDAGSHDIVVTTKDVPSVGDMVTVEGTVYKDKDFGSGYRYNVIIENASIKK